MVALPKNEDSLVCGDFFHDDNVAVPIIDRIIRHSHLYTLYVGRRELPAEAEDAQLTVIGGSVLMAIDRRD